MSNWLFTYTRRKMNPLRPLPEDIDIEDIAHALALLCRFNGHSPRFFSVAEHAINVANSLPEHLKLWGLLHDAGEAYLSDIPRPIKSEIANFEFLENNLLKVIVEKYGLSFPMPKEVHEADDLALKVELGHFFGDEEASFDYLSPEVAKKNFLDYFHNLTKT